MGDRGDETVSFRRRLAEHKESLACSAYGTMTQTVIENPVLNSPFVEPKRHFRFGDEGITDEIVEDRRISSYFVPIARPKRRGKELEIDTE
jgi:hypothetical protein